MCESKKGISANQLKRTLGVSYKTAWYLCHRIREAMASESLLSGLIQIDETWVGGKQKGVGKTHGSRHLAMVVGAVAKDGRIQLKVVRGRDRESLHKFIAETTNPEDRVIVTDGWHGYDGFTDKPGEHRSVVRQTSAGYRNVDDEGFHTNAIENVWSLLKRSIAGSYHKVSVKHLDRYLNELEWRFSNRKNPFLFRDTLLRMVEADALQYQRLTA
jgi:hypothetical protein